MQSLIIAMHSKQKERNVVPIEAAVGGGGGEGGSVLRDETKQRLQRRLPVRSLTQANIVTDNFL